MTSLNISGPYFWSGIARPGPTLPPPMPQTVITSLGSTAVFNCTCHYCSGQHWLVNGILSLYNQNFDASKEYLPNGISYYELTIPALLDFNESTVQCVVFNESNPHIYSSAVQLLVQGT